MLNKQCDNSDFSLMVYNCLTQQAAGVLRRHVISTNQLWWQSFCLIQGQTHTSNPLAVSFIWPSVFCARSGSRPICQSLSDPGLLDGLARHQLRLAAARLM